VSQTPEQQEFPQRTLVVSVHTRCATRTASGAIHSGEAVEYGGFEVMSN